MSNITFSGPEQVNTFVAIALKHGLILYARTGMKPNRMWTIGNMLRKAGEITGKHYRRGDAMLAANDIQAMLEATREHGEKLA
jgi:hypothetical protein